MLDEGLIEEDKNKPRSRGWYEREKYILKCYSDKKLTSNAHIYMKYCPRCGTVLTTTTTASDLSWLKKHI